MDTCGTGGDASGTFNISTAAALVAAAAGAKIAKHGNRSLSSRCGSADVLDALGVPTALDSRGRRWSACAPRDLYFCSRPLMHPAMRRVQPIRRSMGRRTVFNVLGPLTNPALAPAQILGVYAADLVPLIAEAMVKLGVRHGFVVHGSDGLDEITLSGETEIAEVKNGAFRLGSSLRRMPVWNERRYRSYRVATQPKMRPFCRRFLREKRGRDAILF